jgi:hypothetical protein
LAGEWVARSRPIGRGWLEGSDEWTHLQTEHGEIIDWISEREAMVAVSMTAAMDAFDCNDFWQ